MANEINVTLQLNVANSGYTANWSETDSYTQNALGAAGGVQTVLTTMTNLDLGSVTTNGFCVLKNLDTTNAVDFGVNATGTFEAMGTLNAGEIAFLRFKSGVVPALMAVTATTEVQYLLLQN